MQHLRIISQRKCLILILYSTRSYAINLQHQVKLIKKVACEFITLNQNRKMKMEAKELVAVVEFFNLNTDTKKL